ncbi:MAG: type VI secretion system ImpA family N-terminal domain-containing protein [Nibricoccus sp.]
MVKAALGLGNEGADLSISGELLELESLAKPVPAINSEGKRVTNDFSEHEPDWTHVEKRCVELLEVSRDLRVAVFYAAAMLRVHGFAGFAQGLYAIKELLGAKEYCAYPQLDATDTMVERWYTVVGLSAPYKRDGDFLRIVEGLRNVPLVKTNAWTFCFREVLAARNKAGGADVTLLERMRAEWRSVPAGERGEASAALTAAIAETGEIERLLIEQTPESLAPSNGGLRPLQTLMQELRGLAEFVGEAVVQKKNEKVAAKAEVKISMQDGIHTRADAVRVLHEVAEFFRKTEPASPVPYFVDRAARLVDRDFLGLLDELAPDALPAFQSLAGVGKETTNNR